MAEETVNVEAAQPPVEAVPEAAPETAPEAVSAEPAAAAETAPATGEAPKDNAEAEDVKSEEPKSEEAEENGNEAGSTEQAEDKDTSMLKTKARAYTNPRKNKKFDPSILPKSDNPSEIRAQVEFYFSDNNLPKDEFLWNLCGGTENKPVEVSKIHVFGRMRRFQPYSAVVKALRDSSTLNITGEEGHEMVSRKHAYDPTKARKLMPCSVYVKGFGDEQPSTQFDIEAFFAKFDTVNAIRLRRTPENLFKGSVFVEFETEEQAKTFLALDPPPKWKGHDLKIMSKQDYVEEKNKLIEEGKLQPTERRAFFEGRTGRGGRGGRGGKNFHNRNSDPNDWKARKADDRQHGHKFGRGRGGRGRGRGGRDRRDRDDKREGSNENAKRARDDEPATEEPPAKKVDSKPDAAVEATE